MRSRFAVALVVALGLSACGGDDGGGGQLSKADYIKEAKAIEARVESGTDKLGSQQPKNAADIAKIFESLKTEVAKARDDLDDITPPDEVQKAHDKTVEAANLLLTDLDGIIKAAKDNDPAKLQTLVAGGFPSKKAEAAGDESDKLYKDAGYTELADD